MNRRTIGLASCQLAELPQGFLKTKQQMFDLLLLGPQNGLNIDVGAAHVVELPSPTPLSLPVVLIGNDAPDISNRLMKLDQALVSEVIVAFQLDLVRVVDEYCQGPVKARVNLDSDAGVALNRPGFPRHS